MGMSMLGKSDCIFSLHVHALTSRLKNIPICECLTVEKTNSQFEREIEKHEKNIIMDTCVYYSYGLLYIYIELLYYNINC